LSLTAEASVSVTETVLTEFEVLSLTAEFDPVHEAESTAERPTGQAAKTAVWA